MERYIALNKFIQYQLWQDCRNNCTFCSEKNQPSIDKLTGLKFVLNKLDDLEALDYQETGIIGGEIFDNQLDDPEVLKTFYILIDKLFTMHFTKVYIATALILDMHKYLIPLLDYLREKGWISKVLLCTSYDLKYRFHTKAKEELWFKNMLFLKDNYPDLQTHVETILTQFFIDAVLSGEFSITNFCEKLNTRIDYIEPATGMYYNDKAACIKAMPDFLPTKQSYIKFLTEKGVYSNEIDLKYMISYQIRASRVYHLDSGQFVCYEDRREPGFRVKCLDTTKKYELGFCDSNDEMEDIAACLCELL